MGKYVYPFSTRVIKVKETFSYYRKRPGSGTNSTEARPPWVPTMDRSRLSAIIDTERQREASNPPPALSVPSAGGLAAVSNKAFVYCRLCKYKVSALLFF